MRNDDETLRLYLLGDLPEEESDRLEQRLIQEDNLSELFDAIEAEVLESWSRGELDRDPAREDRARPCPLPRLRSRAALVRGLAQVADEEGRGTILSFPPRIDVSRPAVRFAAIAAGVMLMVSATWVALSLAPNDLRHEVGTIAERVTPPPPAVSPEPPPPTPAAEPSVIARLPETPAPPAPPPPPPVTAVFQLSTMVLRGEEEPSVLEIPPGTEQVEIQVLLGDGYEKYGPYTAVLSGGKDDLRLTGLEARPTADGFAVVLSVPRENLPAGQYQIDLSGVGRSSETLEIAFKQFEVRG